MSFLSEIYKFKDKIAIIKEDNVKISYRKLYDKSKDITKNIPTRSLIFLLGGNNIETIYHYVGLVNNKCVVTILDQAINKKNLKKKILIYKPNYLILPISYPNVTGYCHKNTFKNYKTLQRKNDKKLKIYNELAILLSTSGSTGSSKLVRQSYENYIENSKAIIKKIKLNSKDSVMTTLPINYTFGLSILNTHLIVGSKIILNESPILQKKFWDRYIKYKPTFFYGVPYMFELISRLKLEKLYSSKIKSICHAGGKLNQEVFRQIGKFSKKNKINFFSMYGQTEATARMSVLEPKFSIKKSGSIGKPLKGGKFFLLKNKKIIKTPNVSGELVYEGKNVSLGYSENLMDLKLKNVNNYKINTGDIAYFDKDGFYFINGRKKRFIKILGHRINLDEVEMMLEKFGFEAHCVTKDDKLEIYTNNKKLNIEKITQFLIAQLKINRSLISINFTKRIKRNKFGKKIY